MEVLRVTNWEENFENSSTKKLKHLEWFPCPTNLSSSGLIDLLDEKNGAEIFGIWILLLEFASNCNVRGVFMSKDKIPYSTDKIAKTIRVPLKKLQSALTILKINKWIEASDTKNIRMSLGNSANEVEEKTDTVGKSLESNSSDFQATRQDRTEEDRTRQGITKQDKISFNRSSNPKFSENVSSENKDDKKKGFLFEVWIESGKPEAEYNRRTSGSWPTLTVDEIECLESAGMELNDKWQSYFRKTKALIGELAFSEEVHMLKSRALEGRVDDPVKYLNALIKKAVENTEV